MKKFIKVLSTILCIFLLLGLGACGKSQSKNSVKKDDTISENIKDENKDKQNKDEQEKDNKDIEKNITLYFSDDAAMNLVSEIRKIKKPLIKNAVEELIVGPKNLEIYGTLPEKTEVINVEVENRIAYVNFNKYLNENFKGGSAGEIMAVYSIVNTIALNEEFEIDKVQVLVEGEKMDTLAGHIDISEPLSADKDIIKE